jgi:putative transcriptional regulator
MNLAGNLLIAPPSVKGNFWYKTTILITEDHANGSMGLVLNKRSQMTISDFGEQIGIPIDVPGYVYLGGPVNVKSLSFLHTNDWHCSNTMRINDQVSLSSSEEVLPRMSRGDLPSFWRLFLGVCGWGPAQLLGEIKGTPPWNHSTSWCYARSDLDLIFNHDLKDQWVQSLDRSGQEFAQSVLA